MLSASPPSRTSTCTPDVLCERKTVACPAEFPPPTTTTSSPLQRWASTWVALSTTPAPANRGPGADDDHVPRRRGVEDEAQAQRRGQGLDRGIPENLATLADDHRDVRGTDVKPIEEGLHVRLALHLLVGEGLRVPAQEPPD